MHKVQVHSNLYLRLCNVHATVLFVLKHFDLGVYPPLYKAQMFDVVHATVLFVLKHFEL
jgi:hypothetical protein